MSSLNNQMAIAERDEVARGIRLLLGAPLLTDAADPVAFDLVRRRQDPLRKWFDYYCGWGLVVEPRLGYARLEKVGAATDASRPARRPRSGGAPFDRRRYTLFCVVAAELVSTPMTTIGWLADAVARACATDPVLPDFDTAARGERMAFVDVLRSLESFGVVEVVDGSTESFADSAEAKVLYRVDSTLLLRLVAAPRGASQLAVPVEEVPLRFEELLAEVSRERRYGGDGAEVSEQQRNLWLRHNVFRRLADDPVLYFADLSADELGYLSSPTGRQLLRKAAEIGGFVLEERAEGVLWVDPDGLATDTRFPSDAGTAKVAALLLLDDLPETTTREQLRGAAMRVLERFPKWAKTYRGDDGANQLVTDALEVLTAFRLVRVDGALVRKLPAAARYAVGAARTTDTGESS